MFFIFLYFIAQTHVQTIIVENNKLNKKLKSKDAECDQKLEEYKFKLKGLIIMLTLTSSS